MKTPWWQNRTMWLWLTGTFFVLNVYCGITAGSWISWLVAGLLGHAFYQWWSIDTRRPYD